MQPFPHIYSASAESQSGDDVTLKGPGLPPLRTAGPAEFGGPGDRWSPETLLVGAVSDCYILTFRAIAKAARLPWISLACSTDGILDRVERVTRFTELNIRARLTIAGGTDETTARRLLEQSERACLITRSLNASVRFEAEITFVPAPEKASAWHQVD